MPRVLPCLDIFCLECLERHFDGCQGNEASSQSKCPTCGEAFVIPAGGLKEMTMASHMKCLADVINTDGDQECQFCGDDKKHVESYCLDCSLPMCADCKRRHARVRGTSSHNLVSVQAAHGDLATDVRSDVREVLQKRHTDCPRHEDQPLMFCCITCDVMLCVTCKLEEHKDHKVEPLDRAARHRRESLVDIMSLLREHKKSTKASVQESSQYLVNLHEEFARAERHVETEAQRLIDGITKEKDKVLRQLAARRQREDDDVTKHVSGLARADRQVRNATHYTHSVLAYASDAEVIQVSRVIADRYRVIRRHQDFLLNKRIKVKVIRTLQQSSPNILPDIDFGVSVKEVYPDLVPATVVRTLKTEASMTGLHTTADDRIVVVSFCGKKVYVYGRTGKLMHTLNTKLIQPISAVVTSSKRIYVTDLGDGKKGMCIQSFSTNGKPMPDHVPLPSSPWGIAVTKSGDFVVCHPEHRKVGIYSPDGTLKQTLKSDSGNNLFNNPRCVAVNNDGNIIISDFAKHNIRLFDPEGKFLGSYGSEGEGHQQLRQPCGVCCDRYGHILIADSNNNRVHVLNAQGELRGYLFGNDCEGARVVEPVALAVTKGGELLVGEWDGRVHIVCYL
ncbi:hypothetical protein V1264_024323 [Littorina saxatilis]|uniref:B box-type domain-containing protein n=2 Tax=Littorina saxatilis TaxID=31220 RepID=A0AAN9AMG6_9CAEN